MNRRHNWTSAKGVAKSQSVGYAWAHAFGHAYRMILIY